MQRIFYIFHTMKDAEDNSSIYQTTATLIFCFEVFKNIRTS